MKILIDPNNQKTYITVIFTLFALFFLIYGSLGLWAFMDTQPIILNLEGVLLIAFAGGWMISGFVGGIWIACHFINKRDTWFKVLSCILFFITLYIAFIVGLFVAVPYAIYLLFRKKNPSENVKKQSEKPKEIDFGRVVPVHFFRGIKTGYYVGAAIGIIIICTYSIKFEISLFMAIIMILLLTGVVAFYTGRLANRKLEGIINIMRVDCDPLMYIESLQKMLNHKNTQSNRNYLLLQLSTGYLYCDDTENALKCLNQISIKENSTDINGISAMRLNNLVVCHLQQGDLESSKEVLERLDQLVKAMPATKATSYMVLYTIKLYRYLLEKGENEGCSRFFSIQVENERFQYGKVDCQYYLARSLLLDGESEKACDALNYVIEHGNKMYMVERAKQMLKELQI